MIIVALGIYAYGWLSHRYLIFPYPQIKYLYAVATEGYNARQLHSKIKNEQFNLENNIQLNIGLDLTDFISNRRVIETLTVPLLATTVDVGSLKDFGAQPTKGPKGGLCSSGSSLVLFDTFGNGIKVGLSDLIIEGLVSKDVFQDKHNGEFNKILDVSCKKFENSKYVYVLYEIMFPDVPDPFAQHRTIIARISLDQFDNSSLTKIWESDLTAQNNAGRLAILDDEQFLITFSHYSQWENERQPNGLFATEDDALLQGKVVKANVSTGEYEIVSKGHRVPQGLFVTNEGQILETEHGPKGGDELNIIVKDGNYGWPNETHGVDYNAYNWLYGEAGRHDNYNQPIFSWVPSIGISNLLEVVNFHSSWKEDILISSLKAQSIFRTRINKKKSRAEFVEQIWIGTRIRDIEETADAQLVLWTDDSSLIFLSVESDFLENNKRTLAWTVEGLKTLPLIKNCLQCHHFGYTNNTHMAPSLSHIFSRPIASDNYKYSDALSSTKGKWNSKNLTQYLLDPQSAIPGTTMVYRVEEEALAAQIVDFLIEIDNMGQ